MNNTINKIKNSLEQKKVINRKTGEIQKKS